MSADTEENRPHIDPVDVDSLEKENVFPKESICENSGDSGVDSVASCNATLCSLASLDVSPTNLPENDITSELRYTDNALSDNGSTFSLSNPGSLSPDVNDATENLMSSNEFSINKADFQHVQDLNNKETLNTNASTDIEQCKNTMTNLSNDLPNEEGVVTSFIKSDSDISQGELCREINKNLTTSTVSLNEQTTVNNYNNIKCKSPFSRSAENISNVGQNIVETNLNLSSKDLNADQILSQYSNHKNKVSATLIMSDVAKNITLNTESITPKSVDTINKLEITNDARYARLPKELLSQDLGSIVKNVHGIFSSMSGSLKNAYTHRTVQKPVKNVLKPIPNGKVMDDIFEDETVGKAVVQVNGTDKTSVSIDIPNTQESKLLQTTEEKQKMSEDGSEDESNRQDIMRLQIESLERVLAEQRKETASLKEKVKQQVDELHGKDQTVREFEVKLDMMSKRVDQAEREKDAAVMRYASVECAGIEARRAADRAAASERAASTEMELLHNKLKSAHSEKQRICQLYDDKCHELGTSEREAAKLREDGKELEGRLKWTQSKLRMEMDAYKETMERAERLTQQVAELEAARDAAAIGAADQAKARQLESDLKECRAALILCRHEKEELERRLSSQATRLESTTRDRDAAKTALAEVTAQVSRLQESNLRLEEEAAELAPLRAHAARADALAAALERETTRAASAEAALSAERARAATCSLREAAALQHAAALTAQHVVASDHDQRNRAKTAALTADNSSLREQLAALQAEKVNLTTALEDETERRNKENRVLARRVAELTEEVSSISQRLEWEKGENDVLRKKHNSAIKELNRELQRSMKRCEQLEAAAHRAGSVSSLSSAEGAASASESTTKIQNGHTDSLPDIQCREPDRQALIERIVSLQRAAARRAERCDFLEEHSRQLTSELRRKARLLRQLLCTQPAGAVASGDSDQHKKEIARLGGGAMAAVWGGDPAGMTLDLSLEMNKRLQAVLEDALLKNITLKENMDTLGEEIARLKAKRDSPTETK